MKPSSRRGARLAHREIADLVEQHRKRLVRRVARHLGADEAEAVVDAAIAGQWRRAGVKAPRQLDLVEWLRGELASASPPEVRGEQLELFAPEGR